MKYCPKCETEKPLSEFGKHKKAKDGLRRECLVCSRLIRAEWKLQNAEKAKEIDARSRAARKEAKVIYDKTRYLEKAEEIKRKVKEWRSINASLVVAYHANWRARHREKIAVRSNLWRLNNLVAHRAKESRRRALKRRAGGTFSAAQVEDLFKLQRGRCACCKGPLTNYHIDHIVALASGGTNHHTNIQLLCPPCNMRKGAKDPITFMQSKGYLL
ncbi:MAG: HNH endonuclease signature motif containing protein [Terriglobia bacterium]|nr:HNH endonuclease signature motif containing protein [Terriglobia bacterium]